LIFQSAASTGGDQSLIRSAPFFPAGSHASRLYLLDFVMAPTFLTCMIARRTSSCNVLILVRKARLSSRRYVTNTRNSYQITYSSSKCFLSVPESIMPKYMPISTDIAKLKNDTVSTLPKGVRKLRKLSRRSALVCVLLASCCA
jgi:hypothetical protein